MKIICPMTSQNFIVKVNVQIAMQIYKIVLLKLRTPFNISPRTHKSKACLLHIDWKVRK